MTDQNRKTLRSFYCRDYLWELFEQMTSDLGCSMDYLINESMRHYARSRDYVPAGEDQGGMGGGSPQPQSSGGYGQAPAGGGGGGGGGYGQPSGGYGQAPRSSGYGQPQPQNPPMAPSGSFGSPMEHRTFNQIPPVQQQGRPQQPPQPQPPQQGGFGQQQRAGGPPPPPPRPGGQPAGGGWASGGGSPMSSGGYGSPPPQPQSPGFGGGGAPQMGQASQPPIYLLFNNNRYVVDKDKFVIGRGSQQTDLTIRDGNISRKHCAVIFRNGSYYIKDMGSTNGVEYRGNRIESKKIEEGDTFYLCDYELRFTYRP